MNVKKNQVWTLPYMNGMEDMVVRSVNLNGRFPVALCVTLRSINGRKRLRQVCLRDFQKGTLVQDVSEPSMTSGS
jgi:hypothetical protein